MELHSKLLTPADVRSRWILLGLLSGWVASAAVHELVPGPLDVVYAIVAGRSVEALVLGLVLWWGVRPDSFGLARLDGRSWGLVLGFGCVMYIIAAAAYPWPLLFVLKLSSLVLEAMGAEITTLEIGTPPARPALVVGVAWVNTLLIAPIFEETVVRGLLLRRWAARWGVPAAILSSSLMFALPHGFHILGAFLTGLGYAVLYLKTQNLLVPIAAHMVSNGLARLEIDLGAPLSGLMWTHPERFAILALPVLLLAGTALWVMLRRIPAPRPADIRAPWIGRQLRLKRGPSAPKA